MSAPVDTSVNSIRRFVREEKARLADEQPYLPFTLEEYAGRRRQLQQHMVEAGIDLLLLTSPDTMCWLTGYASRWYRSGAGTLLPPCHAIALHAGSEVPFSWSAPT